MPNYGTLFDNLDARNADTMIKPIQFPSEGISYETTIQSKWIIYHVCPGRLEELELATYRTEMSIPSV